VFDLMTVFCRPKKIKTTIGERKIEEDKIAPSPLRINQHAQFNVGVF
jgi:hypothetical protein